MIHRRSTVVFGTLVTVAALTVSACTSKKSSTGSPNNSSAANNAQSGGTLYYLTKRPVEHWDPQRTYIGRDIYNAQRLFYRTLVVQPSTEDPQASLKLQPDLATDTGTAADGGKTWSFTLKDGVKWQDGSDITCDDVKYGVSRTFAVDVITGGPNYTLGFLDIPKDPKGGSAYKGPYTKVGQADFDKAVTCSGKTITFHFNKPWADFPYAAASLLMIAPYKQSQDQGDKSNFSVFSDGPYMLQGTWDKDKGGTFVRNPNWNASTDPLRKAYPDQIVFQQGLTDEVIAQRLIADQGNDKFAITDRRVPPALQPQAFNNPTVKSRLTNPVSPYVDYLLPNFKTLTNPLVRQALATATDRAGWITAAGGPTVATLAQSINSPTLLGYKDVDFFKNIPPSGDSAKANALLKQAGVPMPYPITFTYSGGTPTTEKEAAAVKASWEKAGFKVTLNELTDTYYDVIQNPDNAKKYDVVWAGWGADWPSASTVIPPLFDDRINISAKSNGQDYGWYASKKVDDAIDAALSKTTVEEQASAWADIDKMLGDDVAYIPLLVEKFVFLHGSGVKNYVNSAATSTYPDLATISVK